MSLSHIQMVDSFSLASTLSASPLCHVAVDVHVSPSPSPSRRRRPLFLARRRMKRQKVDVSVGAKDAGGSNSHLYAEQISESPFKEDVCVHPGFFGGLCIVCGENVDSDAYSQKYDTSVALKYIHKDLRLCNDEIGRLRNTNLKNLLCHKKLCLVLDLDHTLLNSTLLVDLTQDEKYLKSRIDSLQDVSRGSLFRLDSMHMLTKLRPFLRTFLKEASNLFEMYIYTMGERPYALAIANLLDPGDVYFNSRVIARDDSTHRHQKSLDVVLGHESAVVILDDTEGVWTKNKENLILMERYNFFSSSCQHFKCKSLSELNRDESENAGVLSSILKVLKQIHNMFFDLEPGPNLADGDVRQ